MTLDHRQQAPARLAKRMRTGLLALNSPPNRHESMLVVRTAIALLSYLVISGCGMAKAARETGLMFDKYGCLARDFKGQPPCEPDNAQGEK